MYRIGDLVMFKITDFKKVTRPVKGVWEIISVNVRDLKYTIKEVNNHIAEKNLMRMVVRAEEVFKLETYRDDDIKSLDVESMYPTNETLKEYFRRHITGGYLQADTNVVHKDESFTFYDIISKELILPKIERVLFNSPATIVFWGDGTKTVVKCMKEDIYNKETGFMYCVLKKAFGNKGYREAFKEFKKFDIAPDLRVKVDPVENYDDPSAPKFVKGDLVFRVSPADDNTIYYVANVLWSDSHKCWSYFLDDTEGFIIQDYEHNICKDKRAKWNEDLPKPNPNHKFGCLFDIGDIVRLKAGKKEFKVIGIRTEKYGKSIVNRYRIQSIDSDSKYTTYDVEKRLVLVKRGSQE